MSSANLNRKRRRVENAASALSKPFKSPLRRPSQVSETKHEALSKEESNVDTNDARTPSATSSSPSSARPSSLESHKRKAQINHLASSKKPVFSDPVILDLQKQERALQSRLAILRSELDTAQQALQLESSTRDADLQSLITKWRSVSQNAAEEAFSGAQERVARMGGMKAWRERMKNNNTQWEQEEVETWYGSAEAERVDVDEDELEARKAEMLRGRKESHDEGQGDKEIEEELLRRGAECLPANSYKNGENVTVAVEYLKYLEARVAELEHGSRTSTTSLQTRDFGVQTEPTDLLTCDSMSDCCPDTHKDNDANAYPIFCDLLDFDLQRKPPGSNTHSVITSLGDSTNSRASDGFDSRDTNVDGSKPTEVGSLHDLAVVGGYSFWLEEAYTNLYFSITHFMWPLFDCNAWGSWRHDWSLNAKTEPWKGFFVQMVYAIGSLSYNVLQPGQNHSNRAAEMYSSALSYYPYVMAEASATLQIQASILMIIYSLHCPSSGEISMSVSSIVPFCSATLAEIQKRISSGPESILGDMTGRNANLNELMFITCYMLNEIIVSGWERPVSAAYRIVDDDIHMFSNAILDVSNTNTALQHLFRLRKIQANIRRYWDEPTDIQNSNDRSFKLALDDWRKHIPQYSVEEAQRTYLDPLWMTKLYDYSIIILMQGKRKHLMREDLDDILSAGVEVCLNYRRLQEEGQVMCFTWSAVRLR
ncbi:hypothetical protein BDV38DRAFT_270858 [Aspergillus pseudotamarii]|uniref:Uncharacterized protein n=1 Tax=Aspergillus pseudotamarii TaxID=132259 RepID=A0A5N6SWE0_ASPPS|nr:uncharacterized protein BDV38DRAFT_270858 [Aspergillus pseudotamarii]KAE8138119.1 hypothetical protein BDV38DRAFT_270858 [Aspergillus pseudotamarii]